MYRGAGKVKVESSETVGTYVSSVRANDWSSELDGFEGSAFTADLTNSENAFEYPLDFTFSGGIEVKSN